MAASFRDPSASSALACRLKALNHKARANLAGSEVQPRQILMIARRLKQPASSTPCFPQRLQFQTPGERSLEYPLPFSCATLGHSSPNQASLSLPAPPHRLRCARSPWQSTGDTVRPLTALQHQITQFPRRMFQRHCLQR